MKLTKKLLLAVILVICASLAFAFTGCNVSDEPDGSDGDNRIYWGTLVGTVSEYAESPVKASPVAGVTVKSGGESTVTDEDGNYSIKIYSDGATVSFDKDGYFSQKTTVKSTTFRTEEIEFDVLFYVCARVEGVVKDASGKAVSGAAVSIGIQQITTDAQGKFVFEEVIATSMMIVATYNGKTVRTPVYTDELRTGSATVEIILG